MKRKLPEHWKLPLFEGTHFGNGMQTERIKNAGWKVFHTRQHDRVIVVHPEGCFELSQTVAVAYGLIRRIDRA